MDIEFNMQTESSPKREVAEIVEQYRDLFCNRSDTYARQRERSRQYYRVCQPLTDQILIKHLQGKITVGLYSINQDGKTKWSVIDSDRGIDPLLSIQSRLQRIEIPSYLELSRTGGHLWIYWAYPIDSYVSREILSPYTGDLEVFPAGDIPDQELGLCIRAPLGVHQANGHRYPFVDPNLQPVSRGVVRSQLAWLRDNVQRADPSALIALLPAGGQGRRAEYKRPLAEGENSPIRAWIMANDIRDVVGRYVKLSRSGLGRCPWPEHHKSTDRHPSFMVYARSQRWFCFTSRTGGNAFDFLCRYHGLDAKQMLKQLSIVSE